ncbi:MAG: ABC transporter permease [Trueperaceae bacterium]
MADVTAALVEKQPTSPVRRPRRNRFLHSRGAVVAALLFVIMGVLAISAPWIAPMQPDTVQLGLRNEPPGTLSTEGPRHLLGTDFLGRDVLTRMLFGLRLSLVIGFAAILMGSLIGVSLGIIAGYFGGAWDSVIMRLVDIQLSFPTILIAIAWVAFIGPSLISIIVIIALTGWVEYARVTRGSTLSLREQAFVEGAHAVGVPTAGVLVKYILPNALSPVIIVATLQLGRAIILESTLSFLGLGIQPPNPSLGSMLADGRRYLDTAWWVATMPGLAIMFLVLSANLLGDSLRDILDPRHASREGRR